MKDLVTEISAYENGELSNQEVFNLFQRLLDTGLIWSLQGSYHRMAEELIMAGQIEWPKHRH